jgi:hypothetical protein
LQKKDMIDINNWLGSGDTPTKSSDNNLHVKEDFKENLGRDRQITNQSLCFLAIHLNDNSNRLLIYIHKEDEEDEDLIRAAEDAFERAKESRKTVVLYNFIDNTYKKWNPMYRCIQDGNIDQVDFDSLTEVIRDIQNSGNRQFLRKNMKLEKLYFAVIFLLLKDGIFGVGNNDMSDRDFCSYFNSLGFDVGEKSNLSEHTRKFERKSPKLIIKQDAYKKSPIGIQNKVELFIEEIVRLYQIKSHRTA